MSPRRTVAKAVEPSRDCPLCPRLAGFRLANRKREPDWFNAPVPSFGPVDGRLLIVGLAPGLRGANRTGRPFTGDFAGELLYETLIEFGFARGEYRADPGDGLDDAGRPHFQRGALRSAGEQADPGRDWHLQSVSGGSDRRNAEPLCSRRARTNCARRCSCRARAQALRVRLRTWRNAPAWAIGSLSSIPITAPVTTRTRAC